MPPPGWERRPGGEAWRGGWRGGPRPPWWPDDEPWPPHRRRGPGGFGCLFGLVALLVFLALAAALIAVIDALVLGHAGPGRGLVTLVVALVLFAVAIRVFGGGAWQTGRILDRLVEAARAVESGDYSVRVGPVHRGPRGVRQLARAFDTMADRLEANDRQRRALLADVSHELRTPLAVIRGSVEAMRDGVHPADDAHLGAIVDETRVMERLVEDLRTLALTESGTLALHREPVDPGELVRDVADSFAAAAAAADVRLDVEAAALPVVELDPVRIRQVVGNLVDNAIRHTPPGGRVRVRLSTTSGVAPGAGAKGTGAEGAGAEGAGRNLRIDVSDTGPGVDPAILPHIFDRFAKGPGSTGSGLGLAIARDLVLAHGGQIEVDSRPGAGATLTVTITLEGSEGRKPT